MNPARTLFQKLWDTHRVAALDDEHDLIYIDRQLLYEVTSPQAFESLRLAGRHVRRPETALSTVDHNVPTRRRNQRLADPLAQAQIDQMEINSREFGLRYFGLDDERQGIIHVIGPEQGMTLPGSSIVAGDSHTSTHGAFAALAGLGGCPYAPGASGNASLEDLAHMFQISGVETGLNLEALQPLAEEIAALTQEPIQSRLHKAGPAYALKVCQP